MEKWWKQHWVSRRDYILEHMDELALDATQGMIVLLIDYFNEHRITISHAILAQKLKVEHDVIDDLLTQLNAKGFLQIEFQNGHIHFDIDGIFEDQGKQQTFDASLFDVFETEFARTLSPMEVQRLAQWLELYDQKLITYALREALTYDKKSFDYIERILEQWRSKGLRPEDYEEGKR